MGAGVGGSRAGMLAALIWTYFPSAGLAALYATGELPAYLAACLIPLWLVCVGWATTDRRPRQAFTVLGLTTAALVLTLPAALPAAASLYLVRVWALGQRIGGTRPLEALLACILGMCAAACFWAPAVFEAGEIPWWPADQMRAAALSLGDLLHIVPLASPVLVNPQPATSPGLAAFVVLALSMFLAMRRAAGTRPILGMSAAGAVFAAAGWLGAGSPLWAALSALAFASSAGMLAGKATSRQWLTVLAVCGVVASGTPTLMFPRWPALPQDYSPRSEIDFERRGLGEAVLPAGRPLPSAVSPDYGAVPSLLDSYSSGSILKVSPGETPGIELGLIAHDTHEDRFQVFSQTDATIRILTGWFPGWSATLDGQPLAVSRGPDGFLLVNLRGTSGELRIFLGPTPIRTAAWTLTWSALIALVLAAAALPAAHRASLHAVPTTDSSFHAGDAAAVAAGCLIAGALFAAGPGLAVRIAAPPPGETRYVEQAPLRTESGLELVSVLRDDDALAGGRVVLHWRIARFVETAYGVRVSVPGSGTLAPPITLIGGLPAQLWPTGRLIQDIHSVPGGTSSDVLIEVFRCTGGRCDASAPVTLFDRAGTAYPLGLRVAG
jgi:hypothetical protein